MATLLHTLHALEAELQNEQNLLAMMEARLPELPEGHLAVQHDKAGVRFIRSLQEDGRKTRIAISEAFTERDTLIRELADKSLIRRGAPQLRKNIKAIQKALSSISPYCPHQYPNSIYASAEFFPLGIADPEAWANANYPINPKARHHCIFETKKGDLVRSKSEAWIANTVHDTPLFYRYESVISRFGVTVYPDFQIIRPKDGALIIWEHFGGLHIPGYPEDTLRKILFYTKCGFVLGDTLFYTMETQEHPLRYKDIRAVTDRILHP